MKCTSSPLRLRTYIESKVSTHRPFLDPQGPLPQKCPCCPAGGITDAAQFHSFHFPILPPTPSHHAMHHNRCKRRANKRVLQKNNQNGGPETFVMYHNPSLDSLHLSFRLLAKLRRTQFFGRSSFRPIIFAIDADDFRFGVDTAGDDEGGQLSALDTAGV